MLTNARWLLLKRPENLSAKQEPRLAELLQYNLRSVRAYLLKEDFQFFWNYKSAYWAGAFLDRWCTRSLRSRLDPMKKVVRTLRAHRALLLNWFRAKGAFSSGTVEGFNNKAKLTMRKSYGFRTYRALGFVCSDMWRPYLKVVAKKASEAIHILDRFHIMAKMNKAIDEVRAKEA